MVVTEMIACEIFLVARFCHIIKTLFLWLNLESEHNLIIEKSISTPQPTPPESDSDHANSVIQASNVYTPPPSSSSSSSESSHESVIKNEEKTDDEYNINEENVVRKASQSLEVALSLIVNSY